MANSGIKKLDCGCIVRQKEVGYTVGGFKRIIFELQEQCKRFDEKDFCQWRFYR